jgi:hypothetical protein
MSVRTSNSSEKKASLKENKRGKMRFNLPEARLKKPIPPPHVRARFNQPIGNFANWSFRYAIFNKRSSKPSADAIGGV